MTTRTLSELAELCDAALSGSGERSVTGPASLGEATPDEISFLVDPRYRRQLETTRAAGVVVGEGIETERTDLALLRCGNPSRAFSRIILAFAPETPPAPPGIHPSAVVDPSAELGADVSIGPLCVVGPNARIGSGAVLHASVVVGANAGVGPGTVIRPSAVLYPHVTIGARCVVHGGAVIGSDGFGFEMTGEGWEKIPQCGTVVIEDDVEVGANVTVDCGRFGATRIARGVKIDNLVHIAHNVQVGEDAMLVAQVGIAGSTRIGRRAILAGQAGISGHLDVGEGARVGGGSAVFKDVPAGEDVFGVPAGPKAENLRALARQKRLEHLFRDVHALEQRIADLEGERS